MGQGQSAEKLPVAVECVQDEFLRQARILTEIAGLTYQDFQKSIDELNKLSQNCIDSNGKRLVFAIKKGTDSTILWKGTVRIACVKIDPVSRKVDNYRLLNLGEFLKVCKTFQCQLNVKEQSQEVSSRMTASEIMDQIEISNAADLSRVGDNLIECCICLERKPEVTLPCAHSYCLPCIEQWNVNNKTCPICREELNSTDDTWVLSEVPGSQEINDEIFTSLMELSQQRNP